jgi:hypothetical protein
MPVTNVGLKTKKEIEMPWFFHFIHTCIHIIGNISSGDPPLHANYGNFNLGHTILIQGRAYGRWKGWFAKFMRGGRCDLLRWFCKSLLPPPLSAPLDQHRVTQIEVFIVCMERLVSTWYVAHIITLSYIHTLSYIYAQVTYMIPLSSSWKGPSYIQVQLAITWNIHELSKENQ